MRTDDFRPSDNVEDNREARGGMPGGAGGLGIGTIVIVGLISWYFGIDPSVLLNGAQILTGGGTSTNRAARRRRFPPARPTIRPASSSRWCSATPKTLGRKSSRPAGAPIIRRSCACSVAPSRAAAAWRARPWGRSTVRPINASISTPRSSTTCRGNSAAATNNNACKFSEAYVIAHEVGHHVQDELGILPRVRQEQEASANKAQQNALQVRVELQADCLAGIWANRAQRKHNFLDPGDVDQALQTASAIGDDRLQKETQGYVVPDAFTHGTSEQRKRWFMRGLKEGDIAACNTFAANPL